MVEIKTARQIGATVRDTRIRKGLTQQQLADIAGVSRGLIARLEKGAATALYPEKLLAVLSALGLSLHIDESQKSSSASSTTQRPTPSRAPGDTDHITPELRKSFEIADKLQKKVQPDILTGAQRIMTELAENTEKAAVLQEMMQPSLAKILEQIASATANADFLKTSPLVPPREKHDESGDQQ